MPTRRCMIVSRDTDEKCLGHPSVDVDWWPEICDSHLETIFGRLIETKARVLADQMLTERLQTRPRWNGHDYSPRGATAKLRPGQHLTDQDHATLAFLTGRAA